MIVTPNGRNYRIFCGPPPHISARNPVRWVIPPLGRFAIPAFGRAATGDDMSDRKDDAQKQFAKLQRAEDGKKAMAEYEADAVALRAKTARLRALRLARDAELAAAAPAKKKAAGAAKGAKGAKGAKAAKAAAGSLSDWLEAREDSGHKN
jgi:hypothetical protein